MGQGLRSGWAPVDPPRYIYLPVAEHPDADLALALYREGLSVSSAPFWFLSLYKVLNIRMSKGADQERWIDANVDTITYPPADQRLAQLRGEHAGIGHYLHVQGRCAVAKPVRTRWSIQMTTRIANACRTTCRSCKSAALDIERELGVVLGCPEA